MKTLRRGFRLIAAVQHEIRRFRVEISRVRENGRAEDHARLVDRLETAKGRLLQLHKDAERRTHVA